MVLHSTSLATLHSSGPVFIHNIILKSWCMCLLLFSRLEMFSHTWLNIINEAADSEREREKKHRTKITIVRQICEISKRCWIDVEAKVVLNSTDRCAWQEEAIKQICSLYNCIWFTKWKKCDTFLCTYGNVVFQLHWIFFVTLLGRDYSLAISY